MELFINWGELQFIQCGILVFHFWLLLIYFLEYQFYFQKNFIDLYHYKIQNIFTFYQPYNQTTMSERILSPAEIKE